MRFLDSPADFDSIGGLETVADGLKLRPNGIGHVRRLHAVDDVGAHGNCHVAIDTPEDRLLVGIFNLCDLRQRNGDAVLRIERQVADMGKIEPL